MKFRHEIVRADIQSLPHEWIPGMKLKNEIIWKSTEPTDFEIGNEGESFDGPLFHHYPGLPEHGHIGLRENHNRVFSFPSIVTRNAFKFFSTKGGGHHENYVIHAMGKPVTNMLSPQDGYFGLCDFESADWDKKWALELDRLGVRVSKPVAIIRLEELPVEKRGSLYDFELKSIDELRKRRPWPNNYTPVSYIRACRSDTRIQDVMDLYEDHDLNPKREEILRKEMEQAINNVAEEIGGLMGPREYLEWFVRTSAQSLGRMHRNNIVHRFLHKGNVTLSAEFVDLDSVDTLEGVYADVQRDNQLRPLHPEREIKTFSRDAEFLRDLVGREDHDDEGIIPICWGLAKILIDLFPNNFDPKQGESSEIFDSPKYIENLFWESYLSECPENISLKTGD